jgi:uncharacterized protein
MEERLYGKTGMKFPILSFGAQHIVDSDGCSEQDALKLINYALDHGVRYFDTAHWYSGGESEERLGKVAKRRRKEMWIVTKTLDRTKQGSRQQLEESLRRLQTDYIDEWRMHYVSTFEDLEMITSPGGALETAVKARKEGLLRYISMSNHENPQVQVKALDMFPFDSMLFPASVLDHFILSFVDELVPLARLKGVAVAGMKALGLGKLAYIHDKALRFAFSQPLDTIVVGATSLEHLKKNLETANSYKPLTDTEKLELYKEVLPLVTPENVPWKAREWGNPAEWLSR